MGIDVHFLALPFIVGWSTTGGGLFPGDFL